MADALSRTLPQKIGTVASMEDGVVTEVIDYAAMARQQATYTGSTKTGRGIELADNSF